MSLDSHRLPSSSDQCPAPASVPLPRSECRLQFRHECSASAECAPHGACCFNGCAKSCVDVILGEAAEVVDEDDNPARGVHTALFNYFYG
jgi:hypothetical protein